MIFHENCSHENCLLADNSHDIRVSYLISWKIRERVSQNLSPAAVVIDALRVNQNKIYCLHAGHFCSFLSSADWFLLNYIFKINLFVIPSECKTCVWIQIRADFSKGLIWAQTV